MLHFSCWQESRTLSARNRSMNEPICFVQTIGPGWTQESYETASRHAVERSKQLRLLVFTVTVSALGLQVTGVGLLKMSMVTINAGRDELPTVKIERG